MSLLQKDGRNTPKCIIYTRSKKDMSVLFDWFYFGLGDKYWVGASAMPGDGLVEMFYGQLDDVSESMIPEVFRKPNSPCRVVIATVAFGLGIDIPDVRYIVHWGPLSSPAQYWQEVGRGGRDGSPTNAVMYLPKRSVDKRKVDTNMMDIIKGDGCLRNKVMTYFKSDKFKNVSKVNCCNVCTKSRQF